MARDIFLGVTLFLLSGIFIVFGVYATRAFREFRQAVDTPRTPFDDLPILSRLMALEADRDLLRAAVAEGIQHVERVEGRIRGTVKRAQKELKELGIEHPGLDAEARELSIVDGDGGEEEELPVMPSDVGPSTSSIPGVSADQLRRVRGA